MTRFFQQVLTEINPSIRLNVTKNKTGLQYLHSYQPADLVFLHMNLPSKNGLSSLQEIKNNPLLRHLPVVILGANAKRPDIEMAYMLGASQFFIKPFSYTGLRSALNDLLAYNWNEPELIREQFLKGGRYTAFTL